MDLLGSILGSMTPPPCGNEKERTEKKKAKEMAQKIEEKQREHAKSFRNVMEDKINSFLKADGERTLVLPSMNKLDRSLVHDVAEVAGVIAHSFGEEDVDRHTVLWKKGDGPCEDELACLKQAKPWDPEQNELERCNREELERMEREELSQSINSNKKFVPKSNYRDKYKHLVNVEKPTIKSYGLVSVEEKKDRRTVEQVQDDIRAKKRARENLEEEESDAKVAKS